MKIFTFCGFLALGVVATNCPGPDDAKCDTASTNGCEEGAGAVFHCKCKDNFHGDANGEDATVRKTTNELSCKPIANQCDQKPCKEDSTTGADGCVQKGAGYECACKPNFHFGDKETTKTTTGECTATTKCTGVTCAADSTDGTCTVDGDHYHCGCKEGYVFGDKKATKTTDEAACVWQADPKSVSVSGKYVTEAACVDKAGEDAFKATQKTEIKKQFDAFIAAADSVFKDISAVATVEIGEVSCEKVEQKAAEAAGSRRRRATVEKAAFKFEVEVEYDANKTKKN